MSFLSLAFLAALPLAAAPLLLHFFDRRRSVAIQWGAMQFLQEAATKRTSARRLKELLLLLMRMAALLALIVALARPLVSGDWLGTTDRKETIVVVDNSMSMMQNAGGKPLLAELISRTTGTIGRLRAGDSVRVLRSSPYPVWLTAGSVHVDAASKSKLIAQLARLRATEGTSDLLASLFTAVQSDVEPAVQQRRVVLLTDGQSADWNLEEVASWSRFQDVLSAASVPTQLEVIELESPKRTGNLAVRDIRSSRPVVGIGQPLSIAAEVQNFGEQLSQAGRLSWNVNGKQKEARPLPEIAGGDIQNVVWRHSFAETGVFDISCRVDVNDDLSLDNYATVVVEVVDRIPVLLLEGARELADVQQDTFFVQAALGRLEGERESEWQAVFEPHIVAPDRLATIDLQPYRAIVVPNLTDLGRHTVELLYEYVLEGGGLWLALGPRTDVAAFNHYVFDEGDGLSPLSLAGAIEDADTQQSTTRINPFGSDHPAVAALADVERLDTGDVKVTGRFRFNAGLSFDDVSVLLNLTNGEPLAVEKYVGSGRVIVQSIPLRYQWSDLALSQSFVVMVHDWLAYLTQPRATRHNLTPGDPISVHLADSRFMEATLTTPHGDEIDLASEPAGSGVVFRSSRTILPGKYSLELGLSGERIPFYVQREPGESDLASLVTAERRLLSETTGLSRQLMTSRLMGTHQRAPIWPLLLMLLVVLIAAELMLSGVVAKERFGSADIAETTEDWMVQASHGAWPVQAAESDVSQGRRGRETSLGERQAPRRVG